METATVKIVREWWPSGRGRIHPVEGGRGVFPECAVNDIRVLIVWAASSPPLSPSELATTEACFREVAGSRAVVVVSGPAAVGHLRLETSRAREYREAALVAGAVVQASWGWDESEEILVEDRVGSMVIGLRFDPAGREWHAQLSTKQDRTVRDPFR